MKFRLCCLAGICLCGSVFCMNMKLPEVCIPNFKENNFVKKSISDITDDDIKMIFGVPEYAKRLFTAVNLLQANMLKQVGENDMTSSKEIGTSSLQNGTIDAIHDYLIDEANPSMVPAVCSLIDDLINEGLSEKDPNLLFFRGVILYRPTFRDKIPEEYYNVIVGNTKVGDLGAFGLKLIREADKNGCIDASEYLLNMNEKGE